MTMRGMTNQTLAEKCGYSTASGFSNLLARENGMRIDNLIKVLEAMDCELVIREKNKSQEWIIEN